LTYWRKAKVIESKVKVNGAANSPDSSPSLNQTVTVVRETDDHLVYISGPYTQGDPVENARNAMLVGTAVFLLGGAPFVPHTSITWHAIHPMKWEQWLALDLAMLRRCDSIIRLPGESSGADLEWNEAGQWGLLRYDHIHYWVKEHAPERWRAPHTANFIEAMRALNQMGGHNWAMWAWKQLGDLSLRHPTPPRSESDLG